MLSNYIIIKNIKVQNANALSSAFTIGFPAVTSFMGFMHGLQRKINAYNKDFSEIEFKSLIICCHKFKIHTFKGKNDYYRSIVSTANPLTKDGKRPSFIEEARCNFTASLVIKADKNVNSENSEEIKNIISQSLLQKMKIAGGDILNFDKVEIRKVDTSSDSESKKLMLSLMPGYVLVERRDLVEKTMIDEKKDALDSLLDYLSLNSSCTKKDNGEIEWTTTKKEPGWFVPISVGFQGISTLVEKGKTFYQRDPNYCHRFAESIVTLGEFKMPYRFASPEEAEWQYVYDEKNNLYKCVNQKGE